MYKPQNSMPLESYQVVSPADNQTSFLSGQTIRMTIPRNIGFFDPHTSRLRVQCSVANMNYKMCFVDSVASLIDMVRISVGGVVLQEVTEYATLHKVITDYSESTAIGQRRAIASGRVDYSHDFIGYTQAPAAGSNRINAANGAKSVSSGCYRGQPLNGDASTSIAASAKICKFELDLAGIGLFELLKVVPCIAIGDIMIEIRLVNNDADALKVLPSTAVPVAGLTWTAGQPVLTIPLANVSANFSNLADCPYAVGMILSACRNDTGALTRTTAAGNAYTIQTITQNDTTGAFTITFTGNIAAGDSTANVAASTCCVITAGSDGNAAPAATTNFVINRCDLLLNVIRPPQQYMESMARKVAAGEMMLDLNNYTTYRDTLQPAIKLQTINIPSFVSRAKAVMCVPRLVQNPAYTINGATDRNVRGQWGPGNTNNNGVWDGGLENYRWQVGEKYYPNQPVELDQMLGGYHFSAQHIVELEKCLANQTSIPTRNLLSAKQNFVIGRALSKHGSSVNLEKGIRCYLEYNNVADPRAACDVVTFVNHINRVLITPEGIEVLS